jgi:hypothetical protein
MGKKAGDIALGQNPLTAAKEETAEPKGGLLSSPGIFI